MEPSKFYFNTINPDKKKEISVIFQDFTKDISFLNYNIVEILSEDIEKVIKEKASDAYQKCRVPVIVEHGGLIIDYLNGFPGALSKPMWDLMGDKICTIIPNNCTRNATAISGVCLCNGKNHKVFLGETKGQISFQRLGNNGFQWDPIFIPDGQNKTYAEMDLDEKLKHSQAAKAYNLLIEYLESK